MRREQQNGTVRIGDRGSKQTNHRSHKGSIKAGFHFVNDEISPALKGAYSAVNEFGSKNGAVREDIGCDCGVNDPLQGLILKLEVKNLVLSIPVEIFNTWVKSLDNGGWQGHEW